MESISCNPIDLVINTSSYEEVFKFYVFCVGRFHDICCLRRRYSVENLTIDDETWYEANDEETLSAGDSQSLYHHIARDSAIAKHLHGRFLGTAQCFGGDARPYRFWDIF